MEVVGWNPARPFELLQISKTETFADFAGRDLKNNC